MNEIELAKKLKSITSSLQGLVECPVCLEPAKIPVKQCATGHIVCSKCADKLKGCPSCQQPFTLENPIGYKKLLEALPRFCKYADSGCPEVVECDDHEHETYCGYRSMECIDDCLEKIKVIEVFNHFQNTHESTHVFQDGSEMVTHNAQEYYSGQKFGNSPIKVFDSFFWLEEEYDDESKQLKLVFKFAPVGKPIEDYFIAFEFLNGNDFKCTHTLKAVAFNNEKSDVEPSVKEGTCLIVPYSLLIKFVNDDMLSWKINCFKCAK